MNERRCQSCGASMPSRTSRSRDDKGNLVCDSCKANPQPEWTSTHSSLDVVAQAEMRRREAEAIRSIHRVLLLRRQAHDGGDQAIINHCPFCGSGAVVAGSDASVSCDFCHSSFTVQVQPAHPFMPQTVDGDTQNMPGMPQGERTEISGPEDPVVEEDDEDVASDPLGDADPNPPSKPPSNGPVKPGEPPRKQPFPPKDAPNKAVPKEKADDDAAADKPGGEKKNLPPWLRKKKSSAAYRTQDGTTLDEDAFLAHLALSAADDREAVLESVRLAHMAREG